MLWIYEDPCCGWISVRPLWIYMFESCGIYFDPREVYWDKIEDYCDSAEILRVCVPSRGHFGSHKNFTNVSTITPGSAWEDYSHLGILTDGCYKWYNFWLANQNPWEPCLPFLLYLRCWSSEFFRSHMCDVMWDARFVSMFCQGGIQRHQAAWCQIIVWV